MLDGMRRAVVEGESGGDPDGGDGRREVIHPDVISYSSAITACGNAGQWRRALVLLRDMRAEGVAPNVSLFHYFFSSSFVLLLFVSSWMLFF